MMARRSRPVRPDAAIGLFSRGRAIRSVLSMTDTATAPAAPHLDEAQIAHLRGRLAWETDASDVHAAQDGGERFVLVDTRGDLAWAQGRAVGAVHLPTAAIAERAAAEIPLDVPVVVYCWGPGCNGSTKAALAFALQGYRVREMIGGFEYWAREGYPVETDAGRIHRPVDALTAPTAGVACDC
jgi:rhodanese-related sulfurtransferase